MIGFIIICYLFIGFLTVINYWEKFDCHWEKMEDVCFCPIIGFCWPITFIGEFFI